jgi:hypothetical protein
MAYPIVMTRLGFNHTGEQANNISLHWTPLLEPLSVLLPLGPYFSLVHLFLILYITDLLLVIMILSILIYQ